MLKRPERLRLEVHVDRQQQVCKRHAEADRQQHVRRQPEAHADRDGGEGVHEVVEVVAVARPLDPAHAGERAVEAVAEPLDHEQAR